MIFNFDDLRKTLKKMKPENWADIIKIYCNEYQAEELSTILREQHRIGMSFLPIPSEVKLDKDDVVVVMRKDMDNLVVEIIKNAKKR